MTGGRQRPLKLGFACAWWRPRNTTWSYTPAQLLEALERSDVDVVDIDTSRSVPAASLLAGVFGGHISWKYSRLNDRLSANRMRRAAIRHHCDAVLRVVADTSATASVPTYAYQDLSAVLAQRYRQLEGSVGILGRGAQQRLMRRAIGRQTEEYAHLAGVFTMSEWLRGELVRTGLDASKLHAVGAGITSSTTHQLGPRPRAERRRLLFVGADFERKAGPDVVAAASLLRQHGVDVELTVVGPDKWPYSDEPPSWINFVGRRPPSFVAGLWQDHDLFVMPSHFEAYGIVFLEARAAGVPCVARRCFAMPELVPAGAGMLVEENDGAVELAAVIEAALDDDGLYEAVAAAAPEVQRSHSWDAVANRMIGIIESGPRVR